VWDARCLVYLIGGGLGGKRTDEKKAACKVHTAPSTKNGGNETACFPHAVSSKKDRKRDGVWGARRLAVPCTSSPPAVLHILPDLPSSQPLQSPYPYLHVVGLGDVALLGSSGTADGRCCCRWGRVTWHRWAALSLSSGGGDVALLGGFIRVVGGR
jgi:hypothetical protein